MRKNLAPSGSRPGSIPGSLALLALVVIAVGLWPQPAHAYIDPGTGSFVIQGIIAAVVGASFALKIFWRRIVSAITGKAPVEDDDDQ